MNKEYYSTKEVAHLLKLPIQKIRNKIKSVSKKYSTLLIKDNQGNWKIHRLALPSFKSKPITTSVAPPTVALTINTEIYYSKEELDTIVKYLFDEVIELKTLKYVVELGGRFGKPHLHFIIQKPNLTEFLEKFEWIAIFSSKSKLIYSIYWNTYISKETPIITLTK